MLRAQDATPTRSSMLTRDTEPQPVYYTWDRYPGYPKYDYQPEPPPVQRFICRLGGYVHNAAAFSYRWATRRFTRAIESYVPNIIIPPEHVIVFEYNTNGRKRRVVAMPGHYPNLSLSPSKNAAVAAPNTISSPIKSPNLSLRKTIPPKPLDYRSPPNKHAAAGPSYFDTTTQTNAAENQLHTTFPPYFSKAEMKKRADAKLANQAASSMTASNATLPTPSNSRPGSSDGQNNNQQPQPQAPVQQPPSQAPDQQPPSQASNSNQQGQSQTSDSNQQGQSQTSNSDQQGQTQTSNSNEQPQAPGSDDISTLPIPKPGTRDWDRQKAIQALFGPDSLLWARPARTSRLPTDCYPKSILKNEHRDKEVNDRISKAKKVAFLSPKDRAVVHVFRERKQTAADELALRRAREKNEAAEARMTEAEREWVKGARAREDKEKDRVKRAAFQAEREWEKAEEQRLNDEAKAEEERLAKEAEERRLAHEAKIEADRAHFRAISSPGEDSFLIESNRTVQLISTIPAEWEERIYEQMQVRDQEQPVVTAPNRVTLTRRDFGKLLPQRGTTDDKNGWLNDNIVNGFLSTIVQTKKDQTGWKQGDTPAFEAYDSTWYLKARDEGIKSISRWSRKKKIDGSKLLKAEKIFFPASDGSHWTLLIISPKERKIEYLDSLYGTTNSKYFFGIAREWLAMELGTKYIASEWTEMDSASQRQRNHNDCGVFTCFNALASAKGKDFQFVNSNKMEEARHLMAAVLMKGRLREEFEL